MTSTARQPTARDRVPDARRTADGGGNGQLRQMVLLFETAAVLEARARRTDDPAQVAVLLRRAEQRRQQAGRLREELAAHGAALGAEHVERGSGTSKFRPPAASGESHRS